MPFHLNATPDAMTANLLSRETSPYLLQHQDNPVHWQPWGPAALARARQTAKPILLSIGYAACHWCHVMAHESFQDPATAELMNRLFVNIKVDREERPDIDAIYMAALHLLGQPGGWPLTMFLTANGEPFWGGTYFPPAPAHGRPSFAAVLREVARLHNQEPDTVDHNRQLITGRLQALSEVSASSETVLGLADAEAGAGQLAALIDKRGGGMRGAPKFPQCAIFLAIAEAGIRRNDPELQSLFLTTMRAICQGGIHDHIGGGFARYSVDSRWLVPHFEKMLYDNAALIDALTLAWQISGENLFRGRIEHTVEWLAREMVTDEGGFASSLDADTEGGEGRYYIWSITEIRQVLGPDADAFCAQYDITEAGNWEGVNIPNRLQALDAGNATADGAAMAPLLAKLRSHREKRPAPARDDKVLADWNAMMICALAHAATVFARPDWLALAERSFRFVAESMSDGDTLHHSGRQGRNGARGMAGDYANMAHAALALYQAGGGNGASASAYVAKAEAWMAILEARFSDRRGGYYMTDQDTPDLIIRPRSGTDDATPNANAVALEVYSLLRCFTGNTAYADRVQALSGVFAGPARANAFGHASLLRNLARHHTRLEIVITGEQSDPLSRKLYDQACTAMAPGRTVVRVGKSTNLPLEHPARLKPRDQSAAFICSRQTCSAPLTDPTGLLAEIAARRQTYTSGIGN